MWSDNCVYIFGYLLSAFYLLAIPIASSLPTRPDVRIVNIDQSKPNQDGLDTNLQSYEYNAAFNCRMYIIPNVKNALDCAALIEDNVSPDPKLQQGKKVGVGCYWDAMKTIADQQGACICPRNQAKCQDEALVSKCHWYQDAFVSGYGECISSTERFYNVLHNLLARRGKKDFAIRIKYSSTPARGQLPLGPLGPAFIGQGSDVQFHHGRKNIPSKFINTLGYGSYDNLWYPNAGYQGTGYYGYMPYSYNYGYPAPNNLGLGRVYDDPYMFRPRPRGFYRRNDYSSNGDLYLHSQLPEYSENDRYFYGGNRNNYVDDYDVDYGENHARLGRQYKRASANYEDYNLFNENDSFNNHYRY